MFEELEDAEWLREQCAIKTHQQIADELGIARTTVSKYCKKHGIVSNPYRWTKGKPKTPEHRAKQSAAAYKRWKENPITDELKVKMSQARRHKPEYMKQGRDFTYVPGRKEVLTYRLVMEQVLGRQLSPDEIVHHKDGNCRNNDPSNLEVTTQADHAKEHNESRNRDSKGRLTKFNDPITFTPAFRNTTHKECTRCHIVKERSAFTPYKLTGKIKYTDAHSAWCKPCAAEAARIRWALKKSI